MSKSMGSHDNLSLLFMMKVMVACHVYLFISNVFLGEILPFDNPKKNATNLLKDFFAEKMAQSCYIPRREKNKFTIFRP
jgi:hypothetical protein